MRDDNTKVHNTWYHCENVIQWCFEESAGLAFLSLQAEKYGILILSSQLGDGNS